MAGQGINEGASAMNEGAGYIGDVKSDGLAHIAEPLRSLAVRVDSLHLDPSNANKHGEKNIRGLTASFSRFGQRKPIVVQASGRIVRAGNGTLEVARALGWEWIAATVIDEGHTQATAYAIADNQTGRTSEWDDDILAATLESLAADGVDLHDLGFDDDDLSAIITDLDTGGDTDADDVPEVPEEARSKAGDVWTLGDHRLMCGDSTSATDVAALLDGEKPFMMVTDPPYGVEYDASWREGVVDDVKRSTDPVINDHRDGWVEAWALFSGDVAYVWHSPHRARRVQADLASADLLLRSQIIWNKPQGVISRCHYHPKHEPCFYTVRKGRAADWKGERDKHTVWDIALPATERKETTHSTQKPVECMARPIRNHGKRGDAVYEPFSGSGTTVIACEQLGRRCYAMEIHPPYVDMAVERWERFTGREAVLVRSAP